MAPCLLNLKPPRSGSRFLMLSYGMNLGLGHLLDHNLRESNNSLQLHCKYIHDVGMKPCLLPNKGWNWLDFINNDVREFPHVKLLASLLMTLVSLLRIVMTKCC